MRIGQGHKIDLLQNILVTKKHSGAIERANIDILSLYVEASKVFVACQLFCSEGGDGNGSSERSGVGHDVGSAHAHLTHHHLHHSAAHVHVAHFVLRLHHVVVQFHHHLLVLLGAGSVEDGVRIEITGLDHSVVTLRSVKVVRRVGREFLVLLLGEGKDLRHAGMCEAENTVRGSETTNVGVEGVIVDLLGEQGVVGGLAVFTIVSSLPGVEDGGDEWVVHVATSLTIEIECDSNGVTITQAVAIGHVHLEVVVLSIESVLRGRMEVVEQQTIGHHLANGPGGIKGHVSRFSPVQYLGVVYTSRQMHLP